LICRHGFKGMPSHETTPWQPFLRKRSKLTVS
jgi:hypothetical protein